MFLTGSYTVGFATVTRKLFFALNRSLLTAVFEPKLKLLTATLFSKTLKRPSRSKYIF